MMTREQERTIRFLETFTARKFDWQENQVTGNLCAEVVGFDGKTRSALVFQDGSFAPPEADKESIDTHCKHCDNTGVITMQVNNETREILCMHCADDDPGPEQIDYSDGRVAQAMGEATGPDNEPS